MSKKLSFNLFILIKGLAKGLDYLHKNNIMHRDIKPENIMFKDKNSFNNPCIVDFGFSTKIDEENMLLVNCGTPGYLAPEIANLRNLNERYNEKCDLFSLGVIAYDLFFGEKLFSGSSFNEILIKNMICKIDFTKKSLIYLQNYDLLEKNPEKRINARDLLLHNYFNAISEGSSLGKKNQNYTKKLIGNLKK